jgi:hypothetical protein
MKPRREGGAWGQESRSSEAGRCWAEVWFWPMKLHVKEAQPCGNKLKSDYTDLKEKVGSGRSVQGQNFRANLSRQPAEFESTVIAIPSISNSITEPWIDMRRTHTRTHTHTSRAHALWIQTDFG